MNVLLFSNNFKLLDRWQNALKNFNVTKITDVHALRKRVLEENTLLILDISSCEEDAISFLKPIVDADVYVIILDPHPKYEDTKRMLESG